MSRRRKCKTCDHVDRRIRGSRASVCTKCGDVFPCRSRCDHGDCCVFRGDSLSSIFGAGSWEAIATELVALGYFAFIADVPRPPPAVDLNPDDFGA